MNIIFNKFQFCEKYNLKTILFILNFLQLKYVKYNFNIFNKYK